MGAPTCDVCGVVWCVMFGVCCVLWAAEWVLLKNLDSLGGSRGLIAAVCAEICCTVVT